MSNQKDKFHSWSNVIKERKKIIVKLGQNFKGYCIRIPTEPELGMTAPCKLWCTLVALFTSCATGIEKFNGLRTRYLYKNERD